VGTAAADLRGIAGLGWGLLSGSLGAGLAPARRRAVAELSRQLGRYTLIGAASAAAHVALFLLLSRGLGAQAANALALAVVAAANTAANRRLTFAVRGPHQRWRQLSEGLVVYGLGLAFTSGALALLGALVGRPSRALEAAALLAAGAVSTLVRFLLLRGWVYHPGRQSAGPDGR